MDYTGRLRPKGVSFSGWRHKKADGFHKLKYSKKEWENIIYAGFK